MKLNDPIDPKKLAGIVKFTKEDALKYLENYGHPNYNIVKRVRFGGKNFLKNIAASCDKIDRLKSQIDTGYNRLEKLKASSAAILDWTNKITFMMDSIRRS